MVVWYHHFRKPPSPVSQGSPTSLATPCVGHWSIGLSNQGRVEVMQSPGCKAPPQHRANTLQSQRIFTKSICNKCYPPGNGYISHLGKRKIIFKMLFLGDMLVPWRVLYFFENPTTLKFVIQIVVSTKYFQFILCLVRDVYISGDVVTLI